VVSISYRPINHYRVYIWFVTSLGALDYIVYKVGHCDLLSKNGGHNAFSIFSPKLLVVFCWNWVCRCSMGRPTNFIQIRSLWPIFAFSWNFMLCIFQRWYASLLKYMICTPFSCFIIPPHEVRGVYCFPLVLLSIRLSVCLSSRPSVCRKICFQMINWVPFDGSIWYYTGTLPIGQGRFLLFLSAIQKQIWLPQCHL
jgi:hypothetical protein